jgi:hypothetical protein
VRGTYFRTCCFSIICAKLGEKTNKISWFSSVLSLSLQPQAELQQGLGLLSKSAASIQLIIATHVCRASVAAAFLFIKIKKQFSSLG